MNVTPISLLDLNNKIKACFKENFTSYWVIAEISEITVNYSGHCYIEFIQKDEHSDAIIARSRAVIWSNTFRMIKPYFETTTGQNLIEGLNIMVRVKPEFHEIYGLNLNVVDIEPTYTVGELAVRKQKIIEKLRNEGVLEMNKELLVPYLIKNIAIISSKTAAGLEDFIDQLSDNPHGYKFNFRLFPAVMQGTDSESSIIKQLDNIYEYSTLFDVVVIIRGGGSQADLNCFNSYWLAYNITQFPLPVFTGIGHEQDDTVADMVANTRLKTPTAVAEFLIDQMAKVEEELLFIQQRIIDYTKDTLKNEKFLLKENAYRFQNQSKNKLIRYRKNITGLIHNFRTKIKAYIFVKSKKTDNKLLAIKSIVKNKQLSQKFILNEAKSSTKRIIKNYIKQQSHRLELREQLMIYTDPAEVLKKGYSITTKEGQPIKNATQLTTGDEIATHFYHGKTTSVIK